MNRVVLDASAVAALLLNEPGGGAVAPTRGHAVMNTVNACEVIERLIAEDHKPEQANEMLRELQLDLVDFTMDLALIAARIKPLTRPAGLSLGDRACLALAMREQLPVLTGDRDWLKVDVGVEVRLIR